MPDAYQSLTDRERETLRLILYGHDAKSMADELGLSVHTVNEYLRNARRKLGVTSSKEAARQLFEEESGSPHFLGHKKLGDVGSEDDGQTSGQPDDGGKARFPRVYKIGGLLIMSVILATIALVLNPVQGNWVTGAPVSGDAQEALVEAAARGWLELNDAGHWEAAYEGTAASFREANTLETWIEVSQQVRPPLGEVLSRLQHSVEEPPTPERYIVVEFRTRFENRETLATETVTMVRENGDWRVVGVFIE